MLTSLQPIFMPSFKNLTDDIFRDVIFRVLSWLLRRHGDTESGVRLTSKVYLFKLGLIRDWFGDTDNQGNSALLLIYFN
jgi:hypothetical protein